MMKKFLLLLSFLVTIHLCLGQTVLKTYSGPFSISGPLDPPNGGGSIEGRARYQYKEAQDGSRIFDGNFKFTKQMGYLEFIGNGNFKDNTMIGEWVWERINKDSGWKLIVKLVFDNYGKIKSFDKSEFSSDGKLMRQFAGEYNQLVIIRAKCKDFHKGQCDNGEYSSNGSPKGTWIWYDMENGNRKLIVEYDSYGFITKSGYRENSTGDWVNVSKFRDTPVALKKYLADQTKKYFLRDTFKNNKINY